MLKKYLASLGILLTLIPATYAQTEGCQVDLSTVAALIFQAQAGFSSGDDATGLNRLSQAQTLITSIQSNCEGGTNAPIPTVEPTESTQPTPEATAVSAVMTDEVQVFNASDGTFSITFPAGWVYSEGERSLLIGNSQPTLVALTLVSNALSVGDRGATILVNKPSELVPNAQTAEQIINFYQQLFSSELSVSVGAPQPIDIDGRAGMGFRYTSQYSGFFLAVPLDDEEMLILFAIAPLGDDVSLPAEAIELAKQVRLGVTETQNGFESENIEIEEEAIESDIPTESPATEND